MISDENFLRFMNSCINHIFYQFILEDVFLLCHSYRYIVNIYLATEVHFSSLYIETTALFGLSTWPTADLIQQL